MAEKEMRARITADDSDFRRKTDQTVKKGNWLGGQFKKIGGVIAGAMAGAFAFSRIIQGIKSMITNTADFERSLASLSAITGATGDELKFYGKSARDMARETTFGASEIVEAYKLMGSARPELLKNKDALAAVTKEALILAEASGMDATEATMSLAKAMNQFNIPAAEAGRAINVLAAGSKFGAAEIPAVAEAIKTMGTAANMANISLEESVAMIETLAEKGLSGAESGTMLRNVILMLQKEADHLNPQIVGMSKALENLGAENLTSAEMTQMFGLRNQQAASILVNSVKRVDELTEAVTGTNTAYEQHAVVTDTLHAQWKMFRDTLADLTIKGDGFTSSLKGMLKGATDYLQAIQNTASSETIRWWEKAAILFNQAIPGGMKMTKKEVEALEKARGRASGGLKSLTGMEEELIDILGDGNQAVAKQIKTIADYREELEKEQDQLQKLAPHQLDQIERVNKNIDRLRELIRITENYRGVVEQPIHEMLKVDFDEAEQAFLNLDQSLQNLERSGVKTAQKLVYEFTLLEQAALNWADAVMWAGVNSEGSLKDYLGTVINVTRRTIAAYLAEAVAASVAKALTSVPFPFNLAAGAAAGGLAAGVFNAAIPAFAAGGAVSGPTLALVGEGPGVSRSNPEYIGTADQISKMGMGEGKVRFEIEGDRLVGILEGQHKKNIYFG